LSAQVYFAHPRATWERGTNENTNGLIRQYFPEGSSFEIIIKFDVQIVMDKLNHRPRKCLGFSSLNMVFFQEMKVAINT